MDTLLSVIISSVFDWIVSVLGLSKKTEKWFGWIMIVLLISGLVWITVVYGM